MKIKVRAYQEIKEADTAVLAKLQAIWAKSGTPMELTRDGDKLYAVCYN